MLGQISSQRLECDPLLQAEYAQMTEVNAFTRICQLASWLARDKRINIYKLRVVCFWVVHNFVMPWKQ